MMHDPVASDSLVRMVRKVSRAVEMRRGMKFGPEEMDLLVSLGMVDLLSDAMAKALKEQARCRQLRVVPTSEDRSGSIASPEAIDGISGGTTPGQDASSGRARARRMFG